MQLPRHAGTWTRKAREPNGRTTTPFGSLASNLQPLRNCFHAAAQYFCGTRNGGTDQVALVAAANSVS